MIELYCTLEAYTNIGSSILCDTEFEVMLDRRVSKKQTKSINLLLTSNGITNIKDVRVTNRDWCHLDLISSYRYDIEPVNDGVHMVIIYDEVARDAEYVMSLADKLPDVNIIAMSCGVYDYYKYDVEAMIFYSKNILGDYDGMFDYGVNTIRDLEIKSCIDSHLNVGRAKKLFGEVPGGCNLETWYILNYTRLIKKEVNLDCDLREYVEFIYHSVNSGLTKFSKLLYIRLPYVVREDTVLDVNVMLNIIIILKLHDNLKNNRGYLLEIEEDNFIFTDKYFSVRVIMDVDNDVFLGVTLRRHGIIYTVPFYLIGTLYYAFYDDKHLLFIWNTKKQCREIIKVDDRDSSGLLVKQCDMSVSKLKRLILMK